MAGLQPADLARLRAKAESLIRAAHDVPNIEILVQELRVHQIELELQCQELQQAQAEVEASRDRYRELYESIPIGYVTVDTSGRIYDLNPAGAVLLDVGPELDRFQDFLFFFKQNADAFIRFCRKVVANQEPETCEFKMTKPDGSSLVASLQAAPVKIGVGKGERLRIAFKDVSRRKQVEETLQQHQLELEANRVELQDLMGKLFTAQEEERRRIACDIHDDHCQRITALILEVSAIEKLFTAGMPSLVPRMKSLKVRLSGILDDFRHLTHELHPRHLDTVSLACSMRAHIKEFAEYASLDIDFREQDVPVHLPMPITICLYRLLQESLSNIRKHAKASHVDVVLSGRSEEVELCVRDDGTGFNCGEKAEGSKGLGLTSMQERVRPLRGRVSIESQPGRGTTVTVTVPMPDVA